MSSCAAEYWFVALAGVALFTEANISLPDVAERDRAEADEQQEPRFVTYAIDWGVTVLRYGSSFYAFWLVWRVLLPDLPGPADRSDRIAPYAGYFTDPFIVPVAQALRVPRRLVALVALLAVAAASAALGGLPGLE